MPRLKNLSGKAVILIFKKFGFDVYSQKGSHVKLRRIVQGFKETLTIPLHDELDKGTLKAIIRQSSRYISLAELEQHFYDS